MARKKETNITDMDPDEEKQVLEELVDEHSFDSVEELRTAMEGGR